MTAPFWTSHLSNDLVSLDHLYSIFAGNMLMLAACAPRGDYQTLKLLYESMPADFDINAGTNYTHLQSAEAIFLHYITIVKYMFGGAR